MSIAPITIQRGATIPVQWYRHTHPGGFIRFAWSPTSGSDAHSSFDSRVDRIVCKETGGCGPSDPTQPAYSTNGLNCASTITVPQYLSDGAWTLQWAYFGGWYNAGDYYACVDYVISGGPSGTQQAPFFIGGDYTYPNQNKCLFYSTNALHVCTAEPCLNGTFPAGDQSGAPLGFGGTTPFTTGVQAPATTHAKTSGVQTPVTTKAITSAAKTSAAITSAAKTSVAITSAARTSAAKTSAAVTTGRAPVGTSTSSSTSSTTAAKPLTTHAQPITSGAASITSGAVSVTSGAKVVTTASISNTPSSNCAGVSQLSLSQAVMTYADVWGTSNNGAYRAIIEITVQEAVLPYWYLEIIFPMTQIQASISSADNGGTLMCQTNFPTSMLHPSHAVIQPTSWSTNVHSGTTITVEIFGNNLGGLSAQSLIANTLLQVYTS